MNITFTLELSYSKTDSLQQSIMIRLTKDRKHRRIVSSPEIACQKTIQNDSQSAKKV